MKNPLLSKLRRKLPAITFIKTNTFYWSPQTNSIHFNPDALELEDGQWALLHEAAHALLGHKTYYTDAGLLMLEVAAWQAAEELSRSLEVTINEDHIQDCLNTYRDWLYARSTCPACTLNSLQIDGTTYRCLNCSTQWSVSQSRFCRPYRMQERNKKTSPGASQTMFV
ncbi:MAG TPA: hypothetical protein VLE74_02405 [Candidatus Saccharimonadales bacterium]|nr:hypothetical protein [Candidatus Saccharimonadales bacterium]